jgi:uncharacterized membrane protein
LKTMGFTIPEPTIEQPSGWTWSKMIIMIILGLLIVLLILLIIYMILRSDPTSCRCRTCSS